MQIRCPQYARESITTHPRVPVPILLGCLGGKGSRSSWRATTGSSYWFEDRIPHSIHGFIIFPTQISIWGVYRIFRHSHILAIDQLSNKNMKLGFEVMEEFLTPDRCRKGSFWTAGWFTSKKKRTSAGAVQWPWSSERRKIQTYYVSYSRIYIYISYTFIYNVGKAMP